MAQVATEPDPTAGIEITFAEPEQGDGQLSSVVGPQPRAMDDARECWVCLEAADTDGAAAAPMGCGCRGSADVSLRGRTPPPPPYNHHTWARP